MEKINSKKEEGILLIVAISILFLSMFNPFLSVILAIIVLVVFLIYNYLTKK